MIFSKKGVVEITSYVLLTLIVGSISIFVYLFSNNFLDSQIIRQDSKNMEVHIKKLSYKLNEITSISRSSFSYDLSFETGYLEISNNSLAYVSLLDYTSSSLCLNGICYGSHFGNEKIYFNLTNSFVFSEDVSITGGDYSFYFENNKGETTINVLLK